MSDQERGIPWNRVEEVEEETIQEPDGTLVHRLVVRFAPRTRRTQMEAGPIVIRRFGEDPVEVEE